MRSPSPSSSSSSSTSPEPEPQPKSKKTKTKTKTTEPRYEGSKSYVPPSGMELQDERVDAGEFDWDAVNGDDDTELWLIRVPDSVKPKYLSDLSVHLPSSSSKTTRIGSLKRKHATFDIWNVGDEDDKDTPVGGEEIKSVQCLLPRKSKKGVLFPAPKPIARHILVSAQSAEPSRDTEKTGPQTYQNPPRYSYPKELLKHSFKPYGSLGKTEEDTEMDVDMDVVPSTQTEKEKKEKDVKSKGKKRKGEEGAEDAPPALKKAKKSKV